MTSLYNLFVSVCSRLSETRAIVFHNQTITYGTLYANVQKIYENLLAHGVQTGDVVGLLLKRSPSALATMLAVLKLGATYLPLNTLQPNDELERILKESDCKFIVNDHSSGKMNFNGLWISLSEFDYHICQHHNFEHIAGDYSKNCMYIIYTSGSTGKAKGVPIRQESINNLVLYGTKEIGLSAGHSIVAFSDFSFDMSIPECIMPMLIGMCVVLLDDEESQNPRLIRKNIHQQNISTLLITPTRMRTLLDCKRDNSFLRGVQYVLFGAEIIPYALLEEIRSATTAKIYNLYGPTETTEYVTFSDITNKNTIDIGQPVKNTFVYLMSEQCEVINGPGQGELVIGGIGVAEGYLSDNTKHAFRVIPEVSDLPVYFTGDIAQRLETGELVYIGRCDNQVKYRGFRLGIEAIECTIRAQIKEICDCAVCVCQKGDAEYLAMVYTAERSLTKFDFRQRLKGHLPSYAMPVSLIRVAALPENRNHKIDRLTVAKIAQKYV